MVGWAGGRRTDRRTEWDVWVQVGNRQTLDVGSSATLQRALKAFHARNYVPSQIRLVVLAPQPLAKLRSIVAEIFDHRLPAHQLPPAPPGKPAPTFHPTIAIPPLPAYDMPDLRTADQLSLRFTAKTKT